MSEFLYSTTHLWFEFENGVVKIGITDHLKKRISPSFINVPEKGSILKTQDAIGILESNKATYELIIPFTCKILERNKDLLSHPLLIAEQEESLNWLCTAEICDEKWNSDLMDFDDYQDYIEP